MPRGQVLGGRPVPVLTSVPGVWACRGHLRRCCHVWKQQRVWFCCSDVGQAPAPSWSRGRRELGPALALRALPGKPRGQHIPASSTSGIYPGGWASLGGRHAPSALWPLGVPAREPTLSCPLRNRGRDAAGVGLPLTRPVGPCCPAEPSLGQCHLGCPYPGLPHPCEVACVLQGQLPGPPHHTPGAAP